MKKIIFILITFFLFCNVKCLSKFYIGEKVQNMRIYEYTDYDSYIGVPYVLRRSDGVYTYCLNPFLKYNTIDYLLEYSYNTELFGIDDEQLDRMNLIGYYGYNYINHADLKWYGITQFLIWKELNLNDIYFVDNTFNKINIYENDILEIENLVNDYYTLPSISNKLEYTINSRYEEIDLNNVLSKYQIIESNIDSKIEGNKLIINTSDYGSYKIKLRRNSPVSSDYKIYYIDGYQPLLLPGKVNDIEFSIDVEVKSGSITINTFDSENIDREEATLEGTVYGIYSDNELLTTISTDGFGIAFIDNLKLGNYYIKEINTSNGYEVDNNIYEVIIDINNDIVININKDVIKGNLVINNYDLNQEYNIYNINDEFVSKVLINKKNILEYGYYYIVQNGETKYDFIIDESKDYIYGVLEVEVPNTKKIDYYRFLPLLFIFLGILLIKKATHYE